MTPPQRLWHVEWIETFRPEGDRPQERRYKTLTRAAGQVASVLAAPDDVSVLRGVWLSVGWNDERIDWEPVDPHELLADAAAVQIQIGQDMTVLDRYDLIQAAWGGV